MTSTFHSAHLGEPRSPFHIAESDPPEHGRNQVRVTIEACDMCRSDAAWATPADEARNLRWRDGEVWTVHDWDSLAWQPEAALVGAASGGIRQCHRRPTLARSRVPRRS